MDEEESDKPYIDSYSRNNPHKYSGDYGPYFPSFTMAAFAVYLRITKISRKHFTLLLRILRHQHFKVDDLPNSYTRTRQALSNLPSLPLQVRKLACDKRKGAGRANQETALVYSYSVSDVLHRALTTPSLSSRMYFGPGLKTREPREFWEGALWMESSLFGVDEINMNGQLEIMNSHMIYF